MNNRKSDITLPPIGLKTIPIAGRYARLLRLGMILGTVWLGTLAQSVLPIQPAFAAQQTSEQTSEQTEVSLVSQIDFETQIAPILQSRCFSCHNDRDQKGGFSLQTRQGVWESGQIEPGDASSSNLSQLIRSVDGQPPEMPKDAAALSEEQQELIAKWIDQGADWPAQFRLHEPEVSDFNWWSLQPIATPSVPEIEGIDNPIDAFVIAKLKSLGLTQNPVAAPRDLLRRLSYDLTGLPPSLSDVEDFINDPSQKNYRRFVEQYLGSPRYGERWGRHWLDLARYADTCGYDKDKLRPNAWPYRDYVIRSFNDDKPYQQFVKEQLAGDHFYPETADGIIGLGFIAAGPWDFIGHVEVPETKLDGKEARNLDRDEMVSATFNVFCSSTVQCARCHNHKFDPITQQHYYNLQSIFAAVDRADRPYEPDATVAKQRSELTAKLEQQKQQLVAWQADYFHGRDEQWQQEIAEIDSVSLSLQPQDLQAQYGYHSQISDSPDQEKWIQLDWQQPVEVSKIVLYPCFDEFAGIRAGFGFPQAWQLNASLAEPTPQTLFQIESIARRQALPFVVKLDHPQTLTTLRLTASRLATRQNDYHLALSEIEVFDSQGNNLASNAKLSSLDSIEAPTRWQLKNLCDGIFPVYDDQQVEKLQPLLDRLRALELTSLDHVAIAERNNIQKQIEQTKQQLAELPTLKMVYAAATEFSPNGNFLPTHGQPREVRVLTRGNISQPDAATYPGTIPLSNDDTTARLALITHQPTNSLKTEADNRAALAHWIVAPENPLTWRSIVNRIWLHHFDRGLVSTPNDFGRMGQLPTHPQLLDFLASNFRDNGQSIKDLHRLIVTSQTYQQSSDSNPTASQVDQDNQFYWRANRRKLSAEELRDSILEVSGRLNLEMGGPGYYLFELEKPEHSPHYEYHLFDADDPATHRRSIYRFVVRSQPDPLMATFDCADSSQSVPQRDQTLTALQALSLMNNKFTLVMAQYFAERLQHEHSELSDQIDRGFQLVTGRIPTPTESSAFLKYAQQHGLTNVCRVLFNLNEFAFVE